MQPDHFHKVTSVNDLDRLDRILPAVAELAHRHVGYGVQTMHYDAVGNALLWTLEGAFGDAWTPDLKQAWTNAYTTLSGAMIAASRKAA